MSETPGPVEAPAAEAPPTPEQGSGLSVTTSEPATNRIVTSFASKFQLCEEVYDPDAETVAFEVYDERTGDRTVVPSFEMGSTLYEPLDDALLRFKTVLLPQKSGPTCDTAVLIEKIRELLRQYIAGLDQATLTILVHFILYTWLFDRFKTAPYLRIIGDYGSGKTRLVEVLSQLTYRTITGQKNMSNATIYRALATLGGGTLVLDELDLDDDNDGDAEKMTILRSGWQRWGSVILKQEAQRDGTYKTVGYQTFGPKVFSGRRNFPDAALESRCLRVYMPAGVPLGEVPSELPDSFEREALALRNMLLHWRQEHYFKPTRHVEKLSVENRLFQLYAPIASVVESDDARGVLRAAIEQLQEETTDERRRSQEGRIIAALWRVWCRQATTEQREAKAGELRIHQQRIADEASRELREDCPWMLPRQGYKSRTVGSVLRSVVGLKADKDSIGKYVLFDPAAKSAVLRQYDAERLLAPIGDEGDEGDAGDVP